MSNQPNDQEEIKDKVLAEVGLTRINLTAKVTPIKVVLDEIAPQGESIKIAEVVNQLITIFSINPFIGEFGPAAYVVFADSNGELFNTVIGGQVVLPKLLAVMDRLPVSATITNQVGGRFGEYYDIE